MFYGKLEIGISINFIVGRKKLPKFSNSKKKRCLICRNKQN